MGRVKIYLKMVDGNLQYRDSEGHKGNTITTDIKHGRKIIWKLDRHSGISEISDITIKGDDGILKEGPKKLDFDRWEAIGSDSGKGELAYNVVVERCKECDSGEVVANKNLKEPERPLLRLT